MAQGKSIVVHMDWAHVFIVFPLLEGLVQAEMDEQHTLLHTVKNMGLNFVVMSLESLHALHKGVVEDLRVRE